MSGRKVPMPIAVCDRALATELSAPTSPLERNRASPRGWRNRDSTVVGLGIVAAAAAGGYPTASKAKIIRASAPMTITAAAAFGATAGEQEGIFTAASPAADHRIAAAFPASSFLDSCCLCRKRLQGKDIYIYRGEKAFCSPDCRNEQIVSDEVKENCRRLRTLRSTAPARVAVSGSSPYAAADRLFFTGIATA